MKGDYSNFLPIQNLKIQTKHRNTSGDIWIYRNVNGHSVQKSTLETILFLSITALDQKFTCNTRHGFSVVGHLLDVSALQDIKMTDDLVASYFYIGEPMGSDLLGKQWAYIPADTEMRMLISSTQNHPFRQIRLSTKHMREHQQHGMAFEDRTRSSIRSTTSFFLRFAVLTNKRECISHEL
ncbi:unnamed protein product [Albugo candida]|uniref:Uncharacterized protein n=1 Tax=Albugo candida TaxID=65357 RepID=A0A024GGL1_9STRA|nr:unnamed protein product [Albugo candida]|eukprot:CCI45680.1 unnamed protein product [Albugo candida]